jgi:hypothetical protein
MSTPYGPQDPTPQDETPQPPTPPAPAKGAGPQSPVQPTPVEQPSAQQTPVQPIIVGQPQAGSNQMIMKPTSTTHAVLRGGLAAFLVVAAVVNQFWGARFPSNAPVEMIYNFGITIDLVAAAIVLGIFGILAAARRSVPVKPQSVSPMAVAAVILSGAVAAFWLLFSLIPVLLSVANGGTYQYMSAVGAIFFLGIPWVLGLVFGTLSLRSGGRLTPILATIAIVLGVVLAIGAVTFAVIYGLGLSN